MNTVVKIIVIYLILMTLAGFFSMGIDKRRAIRHAYRIPEATLFLIAALGGSLGSILGMRHFRHNTRHRKFVWGMPGILILQTILGTALGIALRKYFF